jgi:hypothetical protein
VVIGAALLAPPPSVAAPRSAGEAPAASYGAATANSAPLAVAPNPTKRSAEGIVAFLALAAMPRVTAVHPPARRVRHAGREAPTLTRWRIAHGTSTSGP